MLGPRSAVEQAMDALRCATRIRGQGAERRGEAARRLVQAAPPAAGHPAARRATNPRCGVGCVAGAASARYAGTVIAVTHDRYFLDNVAGWILELDRGQGIPYKGNYSSWLEQKHTRLKIEEKTESARQKALARELEWVRQSARARHAKSKARIAAYERMAAEEQSKKVQEIEIFIPPGPKLGQLVIQAQKISKAFGDNVVMQDVSFSLPPGGIVGVIGPNGAGNDLIPHDHR